MFALCLLFAIVLFSYFIIRVASVALEITGLTEDVANFQALSAFTGTGYTTIETESALSNITRRNIIRALIILGNAGFTTIIASLILTFMGNETETNIVYLGILVSGLVFVFMFVRSRTMYNALKKIIYKFLSRYDVLQVYDYHEVLGLGKGFVISKITLDENSWMKEKQLKDLKLDREGTLILSIEQYNDGKPFFLGAPNGKVTLKAGDVITCYGRPEAIKELSERESGYWGDKSHEEQCDQQKTQEVQEIEEPGIA